VSLGAVWQSEEIINYYFGISPDEADVENQYLAGSGVSTLLRFDWNYKLSKRWDLRALVSYRHLPPEISSSPLIKNNNVVTAFVGGVYHF
jgi:outer membrane protein